jgi:3-phosphoglycerate kinase
LKSINQEKYLSAQSLNSKKSCKDLEKRISDLDNEKLVILENLNHTAEEKQKQENELIEKVYLKIA